MGSFLKVFSSFSLLNILWILRSFFCRCFRFGFVRWDDTSSYCHSWLCLVNFLFASSALDGT